MDLYTELVELIDALQRAGVEHAVCGGIAVALHGYVRFTKDIDLLVRAEDLPRARAIAAESGFGIPTQAMSFAVGAPHEITIHRVNKVSGSEYLTLNLVLAGPVLEDVWRDRDRYSWQGRPFQAVSAPGLAKMKRIANRDQDRLDLKKLGFDDEAPNPTA